MRPLISAIYRPRLRPRCSLLIFYRLFPLVATGPLRSSSISDSPRRITTLQMPRVVATENFSPQELTSWTKLTRTRSTVLAAVSRPDASFSLGARLVVTHERLG